MSAAFRAALAALTCIVITGIVCLARIDGDAADSSSTVLALVDSGRYDEAESLARSNLSTARNAFGENSLKVADASDVLVRALRLNGKGALSETLWLAERSLKARRLLFGETHRHTGASLLTLGEVLADAGHFDRATTALHDALRVCERLADADRGPKSASVLDALGTVLTSARSYDAALRALERSEEIKQLAFPADHSGLSRTLEVQAAALQGKGDYPGARERLDRSQKLRPSPGGPHPTQVKTLNLWAMQHSFEGSLIQSRDVSLEALRIARQTLRPDHPEIARTLRVLAATIDDLGDIDGSQRYREEALTIARKGVGAAHYELVAYLNDLGNMNLMRGSYADARDHFETALRIAEAKLPAQHDYRPLLLHNLALVDASLGDLTAARRKHARAIEMWEQASGRDHPFIAVALTELASVLRERGAPADALPLLERALAIRENSLGSDHRDTARTLADLAATLSQTGQNDRAQESAARALAVWEHTDTVDAPDRATVLKLYGQLQLSRGALGDARRYFERALAIRQKAFGPSHPDVADVRANLAMTQARLGEHAEALSTATQAETSGRDHLRLISRYLPERQALSYATSRPRALDLILMLSLTRADSSSIALDAVIRSRALVLDEMAARRHVAAAATDALAPLRAQLRSAEQRLANLLVRGPADLPVDRYMGIVDEARRTKEDAERVLAAKSAAFREQLNQAQAGLPDVRAAMPRGAAMVSFVRFDRLAFASSALTTQSSAPEQRTPSYLAFVVRDHLPPIAIPLGSAQDIEGLIDRWRSAIAAGATRPRAADSPGDSSLQVAGQGLRAMIWDPIAPHLVGTRMILVVPDGALSLVPFVALPGRTSEFLLDETPVMHYLSAERDLVGDAPVPASARKLLALGGADFDAPRPSSAPAQTPRDEGETATSRATSVNCAGFAGLRFPALADTLHEVKDISGLWASRAGIGGNDARVLSGSEADERSFKQQAPQYQVLHLATHGFFIGDSCDVKVAGLRSVGGLSSANNTTLLGTAATENPLVRSGLALAGANLRSSAGSDEDDGILTAEEVASLNLQGTEWAVLSACDTGLGEIKAGEGVFGLRRAFQIAGARTVIMSLWSVDDQATRLWMRALYDGRLNKNLNTADAVREASLTVLRARRARGQSTHPFYWAAFVAAGDWR